MQRETVSALMNSEDIDCTMNACDAVRGICQLQFKSYKALAARYRHNAGLNWGIAL